MALSKEQKSEFSKKIDEVLSTAENAELMSAGGIVFCRPCPYDNRPGCWAFIGDCQP